MSHNLVMSPEARWESYERTGCELGPLFLHLLVGITRTSDRVEGPKQV